MNWNTRKDLANILEKRVFENLCCFQDDFRRKMDNIELEMVKRLLEDLRLLQKSLSENNPNGFSA
jgi:hypothetical protein